MPFQRLIRWAIPMIAIGTSLGVLIVAGAAGQTATPVRHHVKHKRHHHHHRTRHHAKRAVLRRTQRRRAASLASPVPSAPENSVAVAATVAGLREISYYPSQHGWGGMWANWDPGVVDGDMAKLAALGANTVRIFIQPATFGYPAPQPAYIARLAQMLSIAAAHGLKVHLTLFDLWHDYGDWQGSEQWAAQLLAPFHADPRIACVELQNEIDPGNRDAMAWARTMFPVIRSDSGLPVTVSVTGWNSAAPLARLVSALGPVKPDFYDLHFYGTSAYMVSTFRSAEQIAAGTPLLIGETGYSTDAGYAPWLNTAEKVSAQEQRQAEYIADVERSAAAVGLPPVGIWNLNDFPPMTNVTPTEQHFGLYRLDGSAKPAAATLQSYFGG